MGLTYYPPPPTVTAHSSGGSTSEDVGRDQPQGFYSQHMNMMRRRPEMPHALRHVVLLYLPLVSVNSQGHKLTLVL